MSKVDYGFKKWEALALIAASALLLPFISFEFYCSCLAERFPVIFSAGVGIETGLISAVLVLYFQRLYQSQKNIDYYSELSGKYKRIWIKQDNMADVDLEEQGIWQFNVREANNIELVYVEDKIFKIYADYWSNEGGKVVGTVEFKGTSRNIAEGNYLYVKGRGLERSFGSYLIQKPDEDSEILHVFYQHLYPRTHENNVEANKGHEIWEKAK